LRDICIVNSHTDIFRHIGKSVIKIIFNIQGRYKGSLGTLDL
jgi:hypothetical protein